MIIPPSNNKKEIITPPVETELHRRPTVKMARVVPMVAVPEQVDQRRQEIDFLKKVDPAFFDRPTTPDITTAVTTDRVFPSNFDLSFDDEDE